MTMMGTFEDVVVQTVFLRMQVLGLELKGKGEGGCAENEIREDDILCEAG